MKTSYRRPLSMLLACILAFFSFASTIFAENKGTALVNKSVTDATYGGLDNESSIEFKNSNYIEAENKTRFAYFVKLDKSRPAGKIHLGLCSDAKVVAKGSTKGNVIVLPKSSKASNVEEQEIELDYDGLDNSGELELWYEIEGKWKAGTIDALIKAAGWEKKFAVAGPSSNGQVTGGPKAPAVCTVPKNDGLDHVNSVTISVTDKDQSGKAKVHFNVDQGSCVQMSFTSYQYPAGTEVQKDGKPYDLQTVVDNTTAFYGEGEHDVYVKLPDCGPFQLDFYKGAVIEHLNKDYGHPGNLLKAYKVDNMEKCKVPAAAPVEISKVCSDLPALHRTWKLKNNEKAEITLDWIIEGTAQKGTSKIKAGEEILVTANVEGSNMLVATLPGGQKISLANEEVCTTANKLVVLAFLKLDEKGQQIWHVQNKANEKFSLIWKVKGTEMTGNVTVDANGELNFPTKLAAGAVIELYVNGVLIESKTVEKDQNNAGSSTPVTPAPAPTPVTSVSAPSDSSSSSSDSGNSGNTGSIGYTVLPATNNTGSSSPALVSVLPAVMAPSSTAGPNLETIPGPATNNDTGSNNGSTAAAPVSGVMGPQDNSSTPTETGVTPGVETASAPVSAVMGPADMNMSPSDAAAPALNEQVSAVNSLPQTGESMPVGTYVLALLFILLGASLMWMRRKMN